MPQLKRILQDGTKMPSQANVTQLLAFIFVLLVCV